MEHKNSNLDKDNEMAAPDFYSAVKPIRNKARKFNTARLVGACLEYLHEPVQDKMDYLHKLPWLVLLLIKWIISDKPSLTNSGKEAGRDDVLRLRDEMHALARHVALPSQHENVILFLRNLAYQQFIFQQGFRFNHLARQFLLFDKLDADHFIRKEFEELVGIELRTFLELTLCLYSRFQEHDDYIISTDFFTPLQRKYGEAEIRKFLNTFTKSLPDIKREVRQRSGAIRSEEYFEQTLFIASPFLYDGRNYICVDHYVLMRALEHFVYDRMKLWNAQKFMNEFGLLFEGSVENAIRHMGLLYIREEELKTELGNKMKIVDFVVSDQGATVLIDAKAVEMAYQGKLASTSGPIVDRIGSVIKAIEQANSTAIQIAASNSAEIKTFKSHRNYLIVVTYKDLYLGNGTTLADEIAVVEVGKIRQKYPQGGIPPENMYFLTIDEFERLADAVSKGTVGLVEALEKAKVLDSKFETRTFIFGMHLDGWCGGNFLPDYLIDVIQEELNQIAILFRN